MMKLWSVKADNPDVGRFVQRQLNMDRNLLLKLRQLWDEIPQESNVEAMWQIRKTQASTPQAIIRVGENFASIVYLDDLDCWEVQVGGDEVQFDTFQDAKEFVENVKDA